MKNKNFRQFVAESYGMLDISIQSADKYLSSLKRIEELLNSEVLIEQKTDGVKLTVVKVADNGNIDDWVFSYKGNILYDGEFDYQPMVRIKNESIGSSQFKIPMMHFKKLSTTDIPVGTELLIEYLMRKPTLSSNYDELHKMVLIGYSDSTVIQEFGKLKTISTGIKYDKRDYYASILKIDTPVVLFEGVMGSVNEFESGIINKELSLRFNAERLSMTWNNPEILISDIKSLLLSVESKYGGLEEGVVITQDDRVLKFQQDYQNDANARIQIKNQYMCTNREDEEQYWNNVKSLALVLNNKVGTGTQKELPNLLKSLSTELKYSKILFTHDVKTVANIKDDVALSAKIQLIKGLKGNNNCLVLGKFRVLTNGHVKLIKRAQRNFDKVVICIISNKETLSTRELRTKMIKDAFPDINVIHHSSGNLISIINKSPLNINGVYAGTDRVNEYIKQLQKSAGIGVREVLRKDGDISASKVIDNIEDYAFFSKNTPKAVHTFYNELLNVYKEDVSETTSVDIAPVETKLNLNKKVNKKIQDELDNPEKS